jgi:phosphonate transport system substrate-binding protein
VCSSDLEQWPTFFHPTAQDIQKQSLLEYHNCHLTTATAIPVRFTPVTKYELVVEGLAAKTIDVAWLGGYTSVQAVIQSKGNVQRIAMRTEDATFSTVFIARTELGATTLESLKQCTFAFGSNASTSGHLMPRFFLNEKGYTPETFFKKVAFSGAHDKTVKMVESGAVDAGAVNHLTWKRMVAQGEVKADKVSVVWTTPTYVDYCWVVRKDLPQDLRDKITAALIGLDPANPTHQAILSAHSATRYIPAQDEQWTSIEAAARAAGMLSE